MLPKTTTEGKYFFSIAYMLFSRVVQIAQTLAAQAYVKESIALWNICKTVKWITTVVTNTMIIIITVALMNRIMVDIPVLRKWVVIVLQKISLTALIKAVGTVLRKISIMNLLTVVGTVLQRNSIMVLFMVNIIVLPMVNTMATRTREIMVPRRVSSMVLPTVNTMAIHTRDIMGPHRVSIMVLPTVNTMGTHTRNIMGPHRVSSMVLLMVNIMGVIMGVIMVSITVAIRVSITADIRAIITEDFITLETSICPSGSSLSHNRNCLTFVILLHNNTCTHNILYLDWHGRK